MNLISGTKVGDNNSHLLISSGLQDLDEILGGGYTVGSLIVFVEPKSVYSKIFLRYFLAEAIACGQPIFLGSDKNDGDQLLKGIPVILNNEEYDKDLDLGSPYLKKQNEECAKIAWRYPKSQSTPIKNEVFAHKYNLNQSISEAEMKKTDLTRCDIINKGIVPVIQFYNEAYYNLINKVRSKVQQSEFKLTPGTNKKILRIGLFDVTNPLWFVDAVSSDETRKKDLHLFFFLLKSIARSHLCTIVATIPKNVTHKYVLERSEYISDVAFEIEYLNSEHHHCDTGYHAIMRLTKAAPINAITKKLVPSTEYGIKLKQRGLVIEKLHLPPALEQSGDGERSFGCGQQTTSLDF